MQSRWPISLQWASVTLSSIPPKLDHGQFYLKYQCWLLHSRVLHYATMPSLQDICASWPLRGDDTDFLAFAMDIKGAHKTIRIHQDECGLNMLQLASFAYKCCPFDAAFSAFWWARLSAFFIRFLHVLIFLKHSLCAYVDDFYVVQSCEVAALTSSMIIFCVPVL